MSCCLAAPGRLLWLLCHRCRCSSNCTIISVSAHNTITRTQPLFSLAANSLKVCERGIVLKRLAECHGSLCADSIPAPKQAGVVLVNQVRLALSLTLTLGGTRCSAAPVQARRLLRDESLRHPACARCNQNITQLAFYCPLTLALRGSCCPAVHMRGLWRRKNRSYCNSNCARVSD
jgi:hypothetical protein